MKQALIDLEEYLCRHLRTTSDFSTKLVCKAIEKLEKLLLLTTTSYGLHSWIPWAVPYITADCEEVSGHARFETFRAAYNTREYYGEILNCFKANADVWLAQIEQ